MVILVFDTTYSVDAKQIPIYSIFLITYKLFNLFFFILSACISVKLFILLGPEESEWWSWSRPSVWDLSIFKRQLSNHSEFYVNSEMCKPHLTAMRMLLKMPFLIPLWKKWKPLLVVTEKNAGLAGTDARSWSKHSVPPAIGNWAGLCLQNTKFDIWWSGLL